LRNAVVRGLIHARSGVIDVEALGLQALGGGAPLAQEEGHRGEVHRLLQQCQGNRTAAARRLGVSRSTFYERLRRELG
jgi:transcriptional regulator of acetoin/glycerol metabolism